VSKPSGASNIGAQTAQAKVPAGHRLGVSDSYDDVIDAACDAWNRLVDLPGTITSIGIRAWAHVCHE